MPNPSHAADMATHSLFPDSRIILARPDDNRLPALPNATVSAQQSYDGPTYLVISASAPDDALERASVKYGVPLMDLRQFSTEQAAEPIEAM